MAATPAEIQAQLVEMATALVRRGLLSAEDLQEVQHHGAVAAARLQVSRVDRSAPGPLETLLAMNLRDRRTGEPLAVAAIMAALGEEVALPFERIDPLKLDAELVTGLFSRPFATRHLLVPIRVDPDGAVVIASGRPLDRDGRDIARKTAGRSVRFVLALPDEVDRVIREFYGFRRSVRGAEKLIQPTSVSVDVQNLEQLTRLRGDRELEASDQHIINAVDYLLRFAFDLRASDIHIEPRREESHIRFRIDGVMHKVNTIPRNVHAALVSRIKMLARMDIAEKRRPQDGRIKSVSRDRQVEMRVSTMPVATGEKVVIRIFDPSTVTGKLEDLGFRDDELRLFQRWISEPHGIVLVTGPTGSGKSTTLYTALQSISDESINIVTIEDPIEMIFDHLNQVAVQAQMGVTFAAALRTVLRQDPDVIMVGEIRDAETAKYAVQAALTGHLVFSTLHTNDAPTAIPRLLDLGVEPFLVAGSLVGIMAQRLVRRVCRSCSVERLIPAEEFASLGGAVDSGSEVIALAQGEGCHECRGTGYRGRVGIFEMMEIDSQIRAAIQQRRDIEELRNIAIRNGMRTLRQAGLALAREGETTLDEVVRATMDLA